jgi:two-component system nitrogen regulation sensor histidine kinase NtrY
VKNATEAVAAVPEQERGPGRIEVSLSDEDPELLRIEIADNGKGFPQEGRQRLLEPYMTTREGGTGLGLAIVSKILEEHGGRIELADNPNGRGGLVRLWMPKGLPQETLRAHSNAADPTTPTVSSQAEPHRASL